MTIDVADHLGLVHWVIRKHFAHAVRGRIEMDDLVQAGCVGLLRARDKFDPERGTTFSTYATFWVRAEIRRHIQKTRRCVRVPTHVRHPPPERIEWLDAPAGEGDMLGHDLVGEEDPGPERALAHRDVQRLLALIPDERTRSVLAACGVGGLTLAEAARALGRSLERMRQRRNRGLGELRRATREATAAEGVPPSLIRETR